MEMKSEPIHSKAMTVNFSNEDDRWIRSKSKATSKSKAEIIREAIGGDRVPLCLNPTVDGKQPSIENRVYSPDCTSTAVTTSFPTKYNIGLRIRKLTPRECFRLMGVSDDRSQSLIDSFPDSVLYHLAGDSIVTTCLMAIFSQCLDIDWVAKAKEAKLLGA